MNTTAIIEDVSQLTFLHISNGRVLRWGAFGRIVDVACRQPILAINNLGVYRRHIVEYDFLMNDFDHINMFIELSNRIIISSAYATIHGYLQNYMTTMNNYDPCLPRIFLMERQMKLEIFVDYLAPIGIQQ